MYLSMTDVHDADGRVSRRRWLAVSGTVLGGAFAGCLGGDDDGPEDDTGNTGNQTGNNTGDQSGDDDDDQTGNEEGSLPVTLTELTVGDATAEAVPTIIAETTAPLTASLESNTEITRPATLAVEVFPVNDPTPWAEDTTRAPPDVEPVLTASEEFNAEAETTLSVPVEGLTSQLTDGAYVAVARVPAADTRAVATLQVAAFAELEVDVYTQTAASDNRVEAGELVLASGPVPTRATGGLDGAVGETDEDVTIYRTVDLAERPAPTLQVPLTADTDTMVVTARNVNGGVYPPASTEVAIEGLTLPDVELVAGYPFQGTDAMRFSMYTLEDRGPRRFPPHEEWIRYGTYGANGDYNSLYITGFIEEGEAYLESDDRPPSYGSDLGAISTEQMIVAPAQSARIDGTGFFYASTRNQWELLEDTPSGFRRSTHLTALDGLGAVTNPTVDEREYLGRVEYRDRTADVYRVDTRIDGFIHYDNKIFVDPATGHVLRLERDPMAEEGRWAESYEIAEFFGHGEPETADIEMMKSRSKPNTGPDLSKLPWEHATD
jgi:hypothetical protein